MDDALLADLLLRAVRTLPDDERDAALTELVRRGLGGGGGPEAGRGLVVEDALPAATPPPVASWSRLLRASSPWGGFGPAEQLLGAAGGRRPEPMRPGVSRQTVPVRLTQEQYDRLKSWCQANGFTMATVLRGLVDRFLEQYDGDALAVPDEDAGREVG